MRFIVLKGLRLGTRFPGYRELSQKSEVSQNKKMIKPQFVNFSFHEISSLTCQHTGIVQPRIENSVRHTK